MENYKKSEALIESLKKQLEEKYSQNLIEVYECMKKLRATVQKLKTKIECINEIKENSILAFLVDSEDETIKKDKIDQLTKVLQKICQRMDNEIKPNDKVNNSVLSSEGNNNKIPLNTTKKSSGEKLDDEANKVFLEKVKMFEETFLNLSIYYQMVLIS